MYQFRNFEKAGNLYCGIVKRWFGFMGVRKRNRRKIVVDEKSYVWYVTQDYDSEYNLLNIVSEDKQLILSVPLKTDMTYIISKGKVFQNTKTSGRWERYELPIAITDAITPKTVAQIIKWAVCEEQAKCLEWDGRDIPV